MTTDLEKAFGHHQRNNLVEAEKHYRAALAKDPNNIEARHGLGVLYAQSEQPRKAIHELTDAIKRAPSINKEKLYNSLGITYLALKSYEQATEAFQTAISLHKDYAIGYNNLGKSYYHQQAFQQAISAYRRALSINPNYTEAHQNVGLALLKTESYDQAKEHFQACLSRQPNHKVARFQLGELHLMSNEPDLAILEFQQMIDTHPDHSETYHSIGKAYALKGEHDKAQLAFEQTIALNPKHPECYQDLANSTLILGDPNKALSYYLRQLELAPKEESAFNAGVILMNQNRHRDALMYFEKTLEYNEDSIEAHQNIAATLLKLNLIDSAIPHYQTILSLDPENKEAEHILMALTASELPNKAPEEYLSHLFDEYASVYDDHLTNKLHYQAHHLIFDKAHEIDDFMQPPWRIIDLGCGTGLCGEKFKRDSAELIGIDVSEKMIQVAKSKNIYTQLITGDIEDTLAALADRSDQHADLITAADVFTYVGDLSKIFQSARKALHNRGLLIFTVEATHTQPYELQKTIRYAHSKQYLEESLSAHHFRIKEINNVILRKQRQDDIQGYLVTAQALH